MVYPASPAGLVLRSRYLVRKSSTDEIRVYRSGCRSSSYRHLLSTNPGYQRERQITTVNYRVAGRPQGRLATRSTVYIDAADV
jgi:hypothetical protein